MLTQAFESILVHDKMFEEVKQQVCYGDTDRDAEFLYRAKQSGDDKLHASGRPLSDYIATEQSLPMDVFVQELCEVLTPREADVFILWIGKGRTFEEIGSYLDLGKYPKSSTEGYLKRAFSRIKKYLDYDALKKKYSNDENDVYNKIY